MASVWLGCSNGGVVLHLRARQAARMITGPVHDAVIDVNTCLEWAESLHKAAHLMQRQHNGRHFRARMVEATEERVVADTERVVEMLRSARWADDVADVLRALHTPLSSPTQRPPAACWPLAAALVAHVSDTVHYLCCLRPQLAGGAIPACVWHCIVQHVLPCVRDFGYPADGQGPWVVLVSAPSVRPSLALELSGLLTEQDAQLIRTILGAWHGQTSDEI